MNQKAERLFLLAQKIAEGTPGFFDTKGPGQGDHATLEFMGNLREAAKALLGVDFSEKRVCEDASFHIDFYIPDDETAIEVALSLHQNLAEYERDIFKCLLARESGCHIRRLLFIGKPGAETKQSAPGPRTIAEFVKSKFGLSIEMWELVRPDSS